MAAYVKQYEWCRKCGALLVEKSRWPVCHWCGMASDVGDEYRGMAEAGMLAEPEVDGAELDDAWPKAGQP